MAKLLSVITLLLFFLTSFSQKTRYRLAKEYVSALAYHEANEIFDDIFKKLELPHQKRLAGLSYFKEERFDQAIKLYDQLSQMDSVVGMDHWYYAQCLLKNEELDQALQHLNTYYESNGPISKEKFSNFSVEKSRELYDDSTSTMIALDSDLSCEERDFGAYVKGNTTYFVSAKRKRQWALNKKHAWDNSYFLNVLEIDSTGTETILDTRIMELIGKNYTNIRFHEGPIAWHPEENICLITVSKRKEESKKLDFETLPINQLELYIVDLDNEKAVKMDGDGTFSNGHGCFTADGNGIVFVSDRSGGKGKSDLWKVQFDARTLGIATLRNLGESINTEMNESFPYISPNGELYFSSDGYPGLGGLDIYTVNLEETTPARNLGYPINSPYDDFGLFTTDDKTGFIASNRPGGLGQDDIYSYEIQEILIEGYVLDTLTKDSLPFASITFEVDGENYQLESDERGYYSLIVNGNTRSFSYTCFKEDYIEKKENEVSFVAVNGQFNYDILLMEDPNPILYSIVKDRKTLETLPNTTATIRMGDTVIIAQTNENGVLEQEIDLDWMKYDTIFSVNIEKTEYITRQFGLDASDRDTMLIEGKIDVYLDKKEKGFNIGDLIADLKPIYFDFNKYDIRPDAAIELDKIVNVMKIEKGITIELQSHTDCRGKDSYNLRLSDKRAKSSAEYIISQGISEDRIYGKGRGEKDLIEVCRSCYKCTEEQHQTNRRTEFIIVGVE